MQQVIKIVKPVLLALVILPFWFSACRKNDVFTKDAVTLKFSTDTVFFDTIFSQMAGNPNTPRSITLQLKVTNPNQNAVKTSIRIAGNIYGIFKINVDGRAGTSFEDVEIRGNDSIYIFVQAYINAVNSNTPFIVTDQILFETNGTSQDVDLVAWTQDANYLKNEVLDCSSGPLLWTSDKPFVIYDSILIPKGCTLTIEAGTHIHSFNLSCILVQGTLIVNGTTDKPVIFEGSRLDDDYKEVAGQWIGIRILPGSSNNKITGAIIKNAYVGIEVDSMPETGNYGLELRECIVKNMSAAGLVNYTARLYAQNNLIYNCGLYSFIGELGGTYDLVHNTFASMGQTVGRKEPGFYLGNTPGRDNQGNILFSFPLRFNLKNNVIYGLLDEEILIYEDPKGIPITDKILTNCLIKTQTLSFNVNGNILNRDPKFKKTSDGDYDLDSGSPCRSTGTPTSVLTDIKNRPRSASAPSIGAYEGQ